jgi:hypothetical protein
LLAKGLTEGEIEMLDGLAEQIIEQNNVQQNAKKARRWLPVFVLKR